MKTIARLLGGEGSLSDKNMMNIYDFESGIAEVRINNKFDGNLKFFFNQFGTGVIKNSIQLKVHGPRNFSNPGHCY